MNEGATTTKENPIIKYFKDFNVLKETKKEYWGLQLVNMFDCTAYFAMFNIIIVTLTSDYGFSDVDAGYVFTLFASTTTIFLFFSGVISDWLGIKKSIYTASIGLLSLRALMVFLAYMEPSTFRNVLVIVSLFLMAPFMAMMQTVFQAANKRFTTKRSRGAGFNLWYLFMNIGAAAGGFVVDIFYLNFNLPRFHIFTLGAVSGIFCVVATFLMIKNTQQLIGEGEELEKTDEKEKSNEKKGPMEILKAVAKESAFWRFVVLITLLLGVRAVFLYLGLLHPKFWLRVIGENAQIGTLQAINPILVIIGLILLIPVLNRFSVYKMLVVGAFITSISLFITAIPPLEGMDVGTFTYGTTVAFLLLLTVGELIWSPRLQEYTAAIAPAGQEGTYLGLSMVPYFLAKTVISLLSGHMLNRWCPEGIGEGLRNRTVHFVDSPYMMWLILGAVALIGTVIAMVMKDWFTMGSDLDAKKEQSA